MTVVRLPYEPRYPSIGPWLESKKRVIPVLSEEDLDTVDLDLCGLNGSPTRVKKSYTPVIEKHGTILNRMPADEAASRIADMLHEAKII